MVQTATWTTYRVPNTLASDTEESVVGTQWHQQAIAALADMLEDVSARRGAGWGIGNQIALIGLQHEDGTDYDPKPDVMVLRAPLTGNPASVRLDAVGAPLFIAEVASEGTKRADQGDKRQAYAAIGVPEYLLFDPGGDLLAAPLLAWRLAAGQYVPWEPEADGWWHSAALEVSFRPDHPLLGVRDRDGTIIEPTGQVRRHMREVERQLREVERTLQDATARLTEEAAARAEEERRRVALEERLAELEAQLRRRQDGA